MPATLALVLTFAGIAVLFRRERSHSASVTGALWIPLVWALLSGSRFVSQWIALLSGQVMTAVPEDGSPIDRLVFAALIASGVYVLVKRRVSVLLVARNNYWLTLFFAYCFAAIFWSDFPFVAFKRWIKTLGEPVMVLIILTEPNPTAALNSLLKRMGYALLPLSVTFIKYFPDWGRSFSQWTGEAQNMGVADSKNGLGYLCLIFGAFFYSQLLTTARLAKGAFRRTELAITITFLGITWWLVSIAGASTGLVALLIALFCITLVEFSQASRPYIGTLIISSCVAVMAADAIFGVFDTIIGTLGKDSSLTGRLPLWQDLLAIDTNPIIGHGFESFWLGDRAWELWEKYWWRPTQSHNGYIEVYLNLGLLGVGLLGAVILAAFWKIRHDLLRHSEFASLRLGLWLAIIIYNYTDATFKALHILWFLMYIVIVEYSPQSVARTATAMASMDKHDASSQLPGRRRRWRNGYGRVPKWHRVPRLRTRRPAGYSEVKNMTLNTTNTFLWTGLRSRYYAKI